MSVNASVSGAEPFESASSSQLPTATRWAVHVGAAPELVEIESVQDCIASPESAETATRVGVTAITLLGGVLKSFETSQLLRNTRPAREASAARVVVIEFREGGCSFCTRSTEGSSCGDEDFACGASAALWRDYR